MGEINLWTGNSIGVVLSHQPHIYGFWKFSLGIDQIRISQLCIMIRLSLKRGMERGMEWVRGMEKLYSI